MNTKNIHHLPIHTALFGLFSFFILIPVLTVFIFKPQTSISTNQVLGLNNTIVDNVSISTVTNSNIINFKYNILAYEVKIIKIKGKNIYFKNSYPGVSVNIYNDYFELVNTSPNSYLVEGVIY